MKEAKGKDSRESLEKRAPCCFRTRRTNRSDTESFAMNFCGGAVDQQVVEGGLNGASVADDAVGVTINPLQCGGCVKGVDSRDDEPAELGPITDSSDDGSTAAETPEETPSAALDVIQEALDEGPTSAPFATPSRPVARQSTATLEQTPKSSRELASVYTASPSPYFLNPLNTEWKDATSASVPPPLPLENSSSSPLKSLMQRLEEGFGVRLTGGPISLLAGEEDVWLYLHRDRSRLCVESSTKIRRRSVVEKKEAVDCWVEIPMNEILRLEIGGGTKNPRSFSIVTEKESNRLVYYDFETKSAIDREVLVSTLVVVLDQRSKQGDSFDWTGGGTRDQPIPCSPSLEEQEKSIPSSPSLQHGGTLYSASQQSYGHLSPRKRTQIFNGDQETETSLVIHVEDLVSFESDTSRFGSDWARRHELPLPHTSLQQRSHASNLDMLIVDEQDECRSDYKDPSLSCSTALTTGAWCAQDICTLALNDIADACLSIFAMRKHADAFCTNLASAEQLTIIEEHIASALGAPTEIYAQVMQSDIWNIPPAVSNLQTEPKDTFVVRNRASQLNAQAARLRGLRNEMTFAAALRQSRERMHFVQTVRSFDDAYSNSGVSRKLRAATEAADRFHSSPLLQRLVEDLAMHDLDGDAAGKDEVAYYDSDPEDVRPRTIRRGPRRVAAERFNCKKEEEENENQGQHQRALSGGLFDELGSSGKLSRKLDEDTIIEIVHAMTNERLTLLWHPTQSATDPNRSPLCVTVWIESGVYLTDGTFLLPKLTWAMANKEDIPARTESLRKVDLLDICRVRPVEKIDRRLHPFAVTQKSFFIETQSDLFLFQAQCETERDRIVYGLKLVIARLASLLMLRDIRAAEEFFGAFETMGPGEPPDFVRSGKSKDVESAASASGSLH